jgi:nucleotide-binding universal stress UspA family protein
MKNILATVDGSAYSNTVLQQTIQLAQKFDALVRFLSIVDVRIFEWSVSIGADGFMPMMPATASYQREAQKILEEKAQEVLKACAREAEKAGIQFVTQKISGSPVEVICEQARMVDLIVMGRRGEYARWGHTLMGATLDGTVRQANKPVFVLPQQYRPIEKMLLAYDRSPQANHGLQIAADMASRYRCPLVVLAVDEDPGSGQRTIDEAEQYLRPYGLKTSARILGGKASEAILKACQAEKVDLVIMGVHGHARLWELLLGCTAEEVLRRIDLPLLLVR